MRRAWIIAAGVISVAACGRQRAARDDAGVLAEPPHADASTRKPVDDLLAFPAGWFYAHPMHCVPGTTTELVEPADRVRGLLVDIDGFEIDRRAVTCAAYRACVAAESCPAYTDWPGPCEGDVAKVPHASAIAYCAWRGLSLPTYAQWQRAARGTDGRPFPAGFDPPPAPCRRTVRGCPFTSESGFESVLDSDFGAEWTRELDCFEHEEGGGELLPNVVELSFDRLNVRSSTHRADAWFRCARDGR